MDSLLTSLLYVGLSIVLTVAAYVIYMSWNHGVFRKMGVSGPKPGLILGNSSELMKMGVLEFDMHYMKEFGTVFGVFFGRNPILMVADDAMLKEILVKQFQNFTDRKVVFEGMNGHMEEGVNVVKGQRWKEMRTLVTQTFTSGKLKKMTQLIQKASKSLVEAMKAKASETDELELKRFFGNYTMDVIAATAFGVDVDSNNNPDDPFVKNAEKFITVNLKSPVFIISFLLPFLIKPLGKLFGCSVVDWGAQTFFRDAVVKEVNKRTSQRSDYVDFLQLMMEAHQDVSETGDTKARKIGLTTSEIISNSLIVFFAGYETTATTLCLLSYEVALQPQIQEKIFKEVDGKLKGEKPNYDNVHELQYLEMCINETLRMYPPASRIDRVCTEATEIKGIRIEEGRSVMVPIHAIHHWPEYWPDPEKFDPERFSPENKAKINPMHFLPFGYGPRNCIGLRLALLEIKIAFARIIQELRFSVGEQTKTPPELQTVGLLAPKSLWLKVERRK